MSVPAACGGCAASAASFERRALHRRGFLTLEADHAADRAQPEVVARREFERDRIALAHRPLRFGVEDRDARRGVGARDQAAARALLARGRAARAEGVGRLGGDHGLSRERAARPRAHDDRALAGAARVEHEREPRGARRGARPRRDAHRRAGGDLGRAGRRGDLARGQTGVGGRRDREADLADERGERGRALGAGRLGERIGLGPEERAHPAGGGDEREREERDAEKRGGRRRPDRTRGDQVRERGARARLGLGARERAAYVQPRERAPLGLAFEGVVLDRAREAERGAQIVSPRAVARLDRERGRERGVGAAARRAGQPERGGGGGDRAHAGDAEPHSERERRRRERGGERSGGDGGERGRLAPEGALDEEAAAPGARGAREQRLEGGALLLDPLSQTSTPSAFIDRARRAPVQTAPRTAPFRLRSRRASSRIVRAPVGRAAAPLARDRRLPHRALS